MTGPFIAHETIFQCKPCSRSFASEALLRLVPSRCNVAYDVLVFVGQAFFQRYCTTQEVRIALLARNVQLCASEIDYLGRKYITYLAVGHQQAKPLIRQAMKLTGGYILHLDATHDGDAPALMTGMDSISKTVLANVKLPSEQAELIVPFLQKLQTDYGTPSACVHDMGTGICKAVTEVFPDISDFICHFHFLRDIGKDFLEPAYRELRKCLRKHSISSQLHALARETQQYIKEQGSDSALFVNTIREATTHLEDTELFGVASAYSLAMWALQGKHSGNGYGFPFDRSLLEFANRILELDSRLPEFLNLLPSDNRCDNRFLYKLAQKVSAVARDSILRQVLEELHWRCKVFDRLRKAMRIAPPDGKYGLNDDGTAKVMTNIRQGVKQFRCKLEKDPKLAADSLARKVAEQIDKYDEKLFANPIEVDTPNGTVTIYPQRTNNILEQFFRGMRRAHRRKTGNNSMCRTLKTMLADTPLVKNLDNPEYMEILLDGKANLEELFAELGTITHANVAESQAETGRILPGFQALINMPTLPEQILNLFTMALNMEKSN